MIFLWDINIRYNKFCFVKSFIRKRGSLKIVRVLKKTPHSIEFSLIGVGRWIGTYKWHRLGGSRQHVGHQQGKHRLWQQDGHTCNIIHTHTRLVSYPAYERRRRAYVRKTDRSYSSFSISENLRKRRENLVFMREYRNGKNWRKKRGRFRKEEFNWSFSRNLRLQLRPLPSAAMQAFPRSFSFFFSLSLFVAPGFTDEL